MLQRTIRRLRNSTRRHGGQRLEASPPARRDDPYHCPERSSESRLAIHLNASVSQGGGARARSQAPPPESKQWEAEIKNLRENAMKIIELSPDIPDQARAILMNITDGGQLADFLATNLNVDMAQKQALLEELDVAKRVKAVQTHIAGQLEIAQIQQKLQKDLASQFSDAQRRTYLREQIKAIKRELGEGETGAEAVQLRTRLEAAHPPAEVMAQAERELKRLDLIPPASPEFSVIVSYIETLADLPWQKMSEDISTLTKLEESSIAIITGSKRLSAD